MTDIIRLTATLPKPPIARIADMLRSVSTATHIARLPAFSMLAFAASLPTPFSGIYVPDFLAYRDPSTSQGKPL